MLTVCRSQVRNLEPKSVQELEMLASSSISPVAFPRAALRYAGAESVSLLSSACKYVSKMQESISVLTRVTFKCCVTRLETVYCPSQTKPHPGCRAVGQTIPPLIPGRISTCESMSYPFALFHLSGRFNSVYCLRRGLLLVSCMSLCNMLSLQSHSSSWRCSTGKVI